MLDHAWDISGKFQDVKYVACKAQKVNYMNLQAALRSENTELLESMRLTFITLALGHSSACVVIVIVDCYVRYEGVQ